MRVLHVISDTNIGGAGVLLGNLIRNFDRERVDSVVALPRESQLLARLREIGVPMKELQYLPDRYSMPSVREVCHLIREEGIELIHANAALSARIAGRRCGIPVLHTRHCCFPLAGVWRLPPVRYFGGIWNRALSDRVIATADAAAQNLLALGIPRERIDVIINGSEAMRDVSDGELACIRAAWGLRKTDFVVGICARLEPCKGHETFLRAAKRLMERYPTFSFRFLVIGDGSRREALEGLVQTLGISPWVRFVGFLENVAPVYRLLRVNVNCSSGTETSCLALSEGMSAGVPCVVSDYGGNVAMVGESDAGIVYPVGDFEALADAVGRIATDPDLEERMRTAAYARYRECYTAKRMADRVTEVYEQLLR